MKTPGIQAYTNNYVNKPDDPVGKQQVKIDSNKVADVQKELNNKNINLNNPDKIVTSSEREFFIKMFPENSEQLEKHELFNRNGKVRNNIISKGRIIDGKV